MKTIRNRWTEKEIQFIKEAVIRGKKPRHIASELKYRTYGAVIKKVEIIRALLKKEKNELQGKLIKVQKILRNESQEQIKEPLFSDLLKKITDMADTLNLELTITITKKSF